MADNDYRRDYRGGGPRQGGGNKRKRFREDDDAEQGYRNPRHRPEAPPGTRIRRGLLEIGEDVAPNMAPRSAKSVAETIARLAAEHWEDDYVKDTFCNVIFKLAIEQPLKLPLVATTVLLANVEKAEVGKAVTERVAPLLQTAVNDGEWRDFKLLLRFVACLGHLYEADGVLPILDELFNRAVDLQTASSEDVMGIELVKIILLTLPYLVTYSDDQTIQQRAAELLEKTDIVASAQHPLETVVDPYPTIDDQEKAMQCSSLISLLQKQLQGESAQGWPVKCLPRLYTPRAANGGETNGSASAKHPFQQIEIPSPINAGSRSVYPEIYFSLYTEQDITTVPDTADVASSLIRDVVVDTLNILDYNRNIAAKLLNELDNFWAPRLFARRGTSYDKLRDLDSDQPTWKSEDVAVDSIFSQIFKLPSADHKLVYYHSLITELCKISPQAIAPSLGRAIRFLYRNVQSMDLELSYRLLDWFAHHLSNFEFRWKWQEWAQDINAADIQPRKVFITGALDKEIRLSFAKRIRETLPDNFQPLVPARKEKDIPDFKYASDQVPYAPEGRQILDLLKKKQPESEVQKVIDSVHEQAAAHGISDVLIPSTDIYMTAICNIGSKSLSHVLSTIDRCKERLLNIGADSEAARRQIITSVVDFWQDHPGNAVNIVDKLLNYTIITPMSVIEWALQEKLARGRALASPQIYELISTTITKVTDRLRQIVQQRNNLAVPFDQRRQIDEVLPRERQGMMDLFAAIEDAVGTVASGAQDEMIERFDDGNAEQDIIIHWAKRWARVWSRKARVEEALVGEAAIEPLVEPIEQEPANGEAENGLDTFDTAE